MPGLAPNHPQSGNRPSNSGRDYRRAYKACIRCRETKAKCEPSSDPATCVKCVRERRDCEFPAERSAKRKKTEHETSENPAIEYTFGRPDSSRSARCASSTPPHGMLPKNAESHDQDRGASSNYDSEVVQTGVSSSKDALGLLFRAAEQQETDTDDQARLHQPAFGLDSFGSVLAPTPHVLTIPPASLSQPEKSVVELWSQLCFVTQGWFSATEAITYFDLFFQNLSSLSPVSSSLGVDQFKLKSSILHSPLLCCTVLMISSRYHVLPGSGGQSRADFIHMRLWKHCERLIARITLSQEKQSTPRLRTLESIDALLLMTEWHPRALHFPPDDSWDASIVPTYDTTFESERQDNPHLARWREEVFEPAKRSERLSWMLVGLATTLAHELGVFDDIGTEDDNSGTIPSETRVRTQRMLFLYVNQLSLRIGCTSLLPQSLTLSFTPGMMNQITPARRSHDAFLTQCVEITKLRKTTTEMFFPSKAVTRHLTTSGRYVSLLEHFQPLVAQWFQKFNDTDFTTLPRTSKQMLYIEYQYVRMYIYSIAIQAVVEDAKARGALTIFDYEFAKKDNRKEYQFIQEVVEASRSILATAVGLGEADLLRYCPVRIFISVTSASIFLLKAISLGTRQSELDKSLATLDRCVHALRYKTQDDMHLASRYGMLLDRHVRKFKRNFRVHNAVVPILSAHIGPAGRSALQPGSQRGDQETLNSIDDSQPAFNGNTFDSSISNDFRVGMDDWLAQPFDPSFAPFDFDVNQAASGLEMSSLDFLWNLPT